MGGIFFRSAMLSIAIAIIFGISHAYANVSNWQPYLATDNVLFPSVILSTSNMDLKNLAKMPPKEEFLGDRLGIYGIKIKNPATNTKIHVSVTIDGLSESSSYEGELPIAGREYTIAPFIRYKTDSLWKIKQPYPTTALFSVSLNGETAQETTVKLSVRTVNDVPYSIYGNDFSFLFSAFVNENSPVLDGILKDALAHNAVPVFQGYNGDKQEVIRQIFAIWNSLQRKGIKYSSITAPSGLSENIYSQHVRLPDESYGNSQANCVDGTVLLASALYKIGMCPVLIMKPGHMFLGVYNDAESCEKKIFQNITLIETTAVGAVHLNSLQKSWKFKTDDGYLASTSFASLADASQIGTQQFNQMLPALNAKQKGYYILDIKQLRSLGIIPITSIQK